VLMHAATEIRDNRVKLGIDAEGDISENVL
jgi:hypothetical protein